MSLETTKAKFFDNKQIIHVAAELIIFLGLAYYLSNKTKKLGSNIEELSQRLEEQEERMQKLEDVIKQMSSTIINLVTKFNALSKVPASSDNLNFQAGSTVPVLHKRKTKATHVQAKPVAEHIPVPVAVKSNLHEDIVGLGADEESDLDDEIRSELQELDEVE
jgi:hypothetical protein